MKKLKLVLLSIFFLFSCSTSSFTSESNTTISEETSISLTSDSNTTISEETSILNDSSESNDLSLDISSIEEDSSPVDSSDESSQEFESSITYSNREPDDNVMDNPGFSFYYLHHAFIVYGFDIKSEKLVLPSTHRSCPVIGVLNGLDIFISEKVKKTIKSVYFPDSILNNIVNNGFSWLYAFENLQEIEVDEKNPNFKCIDGNIYDKEMKTLFYVFHNPTNPVLQIPETVETIKAAALAGLSEYEEIRVADSNPYFTSIDGVLFDKEVSKLILYPKQKKTRYYNVPSGVVELEKPGFQNNPYIENVVLPNGFTTFTGTFKNCTSLINVSIPEGVTRIGQIFNGCNKLESLKFPESLEYLQSDNNTTGFKNIYLPKNVETFTPINAFFTESITVAEENEHFQSKDGVLYSKDLTKLSGLPLLKTGKLVVPKETSDFRMYVILSPIGENHLSSIEVEEGNEVFYALDEVLYEKTANGPQAIFAPGQKEELTFHAPLKLSCHYSNTTKKITLGKDVAGDFMGLFLSTFSALEEIVCSPDSPYFRVIDGYLYDITGTILHAVPETITTITIPSQVCEVKYILPKNVEKITIEADLSKPLAFTMAYSNLKHLILGKGGRLNLINAAPELVDIEVDPENPYYYLENQVLYNKEKDSLIWYSPRKEGQFSILSSVHTIKTHAIQIMPYTHLHEIIIPNHVKSMEYTAIAGGGNTSVERIVIPDSVTPCSADVVRSTVKHIYYGKGLTEFKTNSEDMYTTPQFFHFANKKEDVNVKIGNPRACCLRLLFDSPYLG